MQEHNITAYEGPEKYIFISYAHRDTDQVFPILEQLQNRGYRIWYDDGIAPGSEWPENIAQHLDGCALTMAFVSPNSMASPNCRREINFALSRQKPFLSVVLEPTEMPLGMELQLSAQQSVLRYNYRKEAQFIEKICVCPDLACCRIPRAESAAEPEMAQPSVPEQSKVPGPDAKELPRKSILPKKPKSGQKRTKTGPKTGNTRKKLGIAGGILAAIVLVWMAVSALNTVKITDTLSAKKGDGYLSLRSVSVDAAVLEKLDKLTKLETLILSDCSFEPGVLSRWSPAAPLKSVTLENCTGDVDLGFLETITTLTRLDADNCGLSDGKLPVLNQPELYWISLSYNPELTDLSNLAGLEKLDYLNIDHTGVKSLEPVAGESLRTVRFAGTPVTSLSPLKNCPGLQEVLGSGSGVRDLSPLISLSGLKYLQFENCDLSGMECGKPFEALRLHTLNLRSTGITTLAPFANMTQLNKVFLAGNDLDNGDLQLLGKSSQTLQYLDLSGTGFQGSGWLAECVNLQELYLDNTHPGDLSFVSGMANLEILSANACALTDLSALGNCQELTQVYLAQNLITDLDDLGRIPLEDSDYPRFDFTGCEKLTDISGLPEVRYSRLCLAECPNIDFATAGNISGNSLTLTYNETLSGSSLAGKTFSRYYLLNCPEDRKVSLEDLLGSYNVSFITGRDLISVMEEQLEMPCDYLKHDGT